MFIDELGYKIELPITINSDNQGAMKLAKNSVFHSRSKHIDIVMTNKIPSFSTKTP